MMDISVQRISENREKLIHSNPFNIKDRLAFVMLVHDVLNLRYSAVNAQAKNGELKYNFSDFTLIGQKLVSGFRDSELNQRKWPTYTAAGPLDYLTVGSVNPLTKNVFLEVAFTYSPNRKVVHREFLDIAYKKTNVIQDSLVILYADGNVIDDVMGTHWLNETISDALQYKKDQLILKLFGPEGQSRAGYRASVRE